MKKQKYELTKEIFESVHDIDGFPIGKENDIRTLSNPPFYTAFPNPFIGDFVQNVSSSEDINNDRTPFTIDVSVGKNDPLYNLHSYPTKVPHKAIMQYILHYTKPGDIVFDGFAGTGMTGLAAFHCSIKKKDNNFEYGKRYCILNDLSPLATFISSILNTKQDINKFKDVYKIILKNLEKELSWMYETNHTIDNKIVYKKDVYNNEVPLKGKIIYTVWSDVFICPNCGEELLYWDIKDADKKQMNCIKCGSIVNMRNLERSIETYFDTSLKQVKKRVKQNPVMISYKLETDGKNVRRYKTR